MALSKKIAALLLLLVALTATLEAMPRALVASLAVPGTASAPLNGGPYGSSVLVKLVEKLGYKVLVVSSMQELDERGIWGNEDVAYILVAPTNNESEDYVRNVASSIGKHVESGRKFYFLLMDEAPIEEAKILFEEIHKAVCPNVPVAGTGELLPLESVAVRVYNGDSWVEVASGYTSYVDSPVAPADYMARAHGSFEPETISLKLGGGIEVSIPGWAWPSTSPLTPLLWYPIFYKCSSPRGSVGLFADSTLFINAVLASNESYLRAASLVVAGVIGQPRDDLVVVFDQRMYVDERIRVSFMVRYHPSRVMIEGEKIYASMEERAVALLKTDPLLTMAVALALALGVWSLLPPWTRGASRIKNPKRKTGKRVRIRREEAGARYCDLLDEWLQLHGTSIDKLARGNIGSLNTSTSIEELSRLAKSLKRLCTLKQITSTIIFRKTPLYRKVIRESEEKAFKILVLTGWNPAS